jgi:MoaA/NifB/PqqE/SkfB family radical SAM enzyme
VNPYSDVKVLRDLERLQAIRERRPFPPKQIEIVLSDLCNHDCWFCMYRQSGMLPAGNFGGNPSRFLPFEKALEILQDAHDIGTKAVLFSGGGEPTVHKQHIDVFKAALGHGLACGLITNGFLLRPGWEDVLPAFTWLRVSLDAGDETTYSRVRKIDPGAFWRVLGNVRKIRDEIDCQETSCYLGVGFVVTKENLHECAKAAWWSSEHGAHSIRFNPARTPEGAKYYDGILDEVMDNINAAVQAVPKGFVLEQFIPRIDDLSHPPDYTTCHYQQLAPFIGADQKVYRCCHTAYSSQGFIADISSVRFRDAWYGSETRERMKSFDAGTCSNCTFNRINRGVESLTSGHVPHEEFV